MPTRWQCRAVVLSVALMAGARSSTAPGARTLITFDVDGTLVAGVGRGAETSAHAHAFAHGVGRVLSESGAATALPASVLPHDKYHGSTDGLIALNLARQELGLCPKAVAPRLAEVFASMDEYVARCSDADVVAGVEPIAGVLETLRALRDDVADGRVLCGLVTGNVEGIARKKMRAFGIVATGALSPPAPEQRWPGDEESAFLGGFGSDFCSGDIEDPARHHLDRAEQLAIAVRRARALVAAQPGGTSYLDRVVHVGDAPADVLAAKACAEDGRLGAGVCVACIAVGTGRGTVEQLAQLAGTPCAGVWEPTVLARGVGDTSAFLRAALGDRAARPAAAEGGSGAAAQPEARGTAATAPRAAPGGRRPHGDDD